MNSLLACILWNKENQKQNLTKSFLKIRTETKFLEPRILIYFYMTQLKAPTTVNLNFYELVTNCSFRLPQNLSYNTLLLKDFSLPDFRSSNFYSKKFPSNNFLVRLETKRLSALILHHYIHQFFCIVTLAGKNWRCPGKTHLILK